MFAKITDRNQLTLPDEVLERVAPAEFFEVQVEGQRIILTPVQTVSGDALRARIEERGITEEDIEQAISWARRDG